jgi:hypothetical protein
MIFAVNTMDDVIPGIGHIDEIRVGGYSPRMPKLALFTDSVCAALLASSNHLSHLACQVRNDDAMVVSIGDNQPVPFVVDEELNKT